MDRTGLGTDLEPWRRAVSAGSIRGQSGLWSCLRSTLKQSSPRTWSSESQSPIKLPPRTVKTLSKPITNAKRSAPARPTWLGPYRARLLSTPSSPSRRLPSPDPFRRLLPGRRGRIRFQPQIKDVPVPNPAPLAPNSGAEALPVRCRRGEGPRARGWRFLSLGSNKNLGSRRPSCRKPDIQEINTLPTLKGCSGLRGRDASGSWLPLSPHLPRTAPLGAPWGLHHGSELPWAKFALEMGQPRAPGAPGSFSQLRGGHGGRRGLLRPRCFPAAGPRGSPRATKGEAAARCPGLG